MENPRAVGWLFFVWLGALLLITAAASVYCSDFSIFLWGILCVVIIVALCTISSLLNLIVFAPVLWLISKLASNKLVRSGKRLR